MKSRRNERWINLKERTGLSLQLVHESWRSCIEQLHCSRASRSLLFLIRCADKTRALFNDDELIGRNFIDRIDLSARPLYFKRLCFRGLPQTEMHSQIVLRVVAAAAADL